MRHEVRWTSRKIGQRIELLEEYVYRRRAPLPAFRFTRLPDPGYGPMETPPVAVDVDDSDWTVIAPDGHWGERFLNFVLRTTFEVPADWGTEHAVALYLPLGEAGDFSHPEALAYVDGQAYAACDRHHQEIRLRDEWRGAPHQLALHGWTGIIGARHGNPDKGLYMEECALVEIDQPTRDFIAMARVAHGIAVDTDMDAPVRAKLLNALDDAFKLVDLREPIGEAFYASIPAAHTALRNGLAEAGPALDASIVATGHAHIDVAWLWTLGQTRRKTGRTFHTVLRLMEQFPDYHFTQSQPQLYDYIREDYPELFEAVKARIAEGRWEAIGGMWVEADCNLSGSESLARQFLLGRTFFREHFGPDAESPVLWLPDVFGYAWNLPQLIKEAGLEYFFTIKIGWSQYNRLPYDTFWWQGLDGTKVLTHFSTTPDGSAFASTYNANASPKQALGTWTNFQQKELAQDLFMAYGYGDGGGGPTREMLENIREMSNLPGAPQMRQGSAGDFYRKVEAEVGPQLPTWNGELYLELHRGTYTSQSRNKRANRKSEFLLHDAEFLAALADLVNDEYAYPKATLNKAWELVCLNQFHDIIPGSSITPVYTDSLAQYADVRAMGERVRDEALAAIGAKSSGDVLVVNPTSFERAELAFLPAKLEPSQVLQRADGGMVVTQETDGGTWIDAGELAPYSVTSLVIAEDAIGMGGTDLSVDVDHLENEYVRVEFDAAGDITRILDKQTGRDVLPPGVVANQFQALEDRPMNWDAWDVDIFYDDKVYLAEPASAVTVVERGPLRATLEIKRRILSSEYVQRISLAYNSPRLDIDTQIDWRERHILLKVAFPVDVLSPKATYEIQWGNTERPTHQNTSWDWARFETCAQKWVDLSEGDFGLSVLNDCKYGHDIRDNVIRISLLRAPTLPDPEADQGEQRFAYSILPHAGGWDSPTVAAAYGLNDPLIATLTARGDAAAAATPLVQVDRENVVIETVKRAEDGNGLIVRLYEFKRMRGPVRITAGVPLAGAQRVNLLEETQAELAVDGNSVEYAIRPYEIATLRLIPA